MIEVALHGAEFFARHGFYEIEQVLGNRFILDIEVSFKPFDDLNADKLTNTLNYERLYAIAKEEMEIPRKLLETVVQAIIDKIKTEFDFAQVIKVSLKKLNPPLKGKVHSSVVTITYNKAE